MLSRWTTWTVSFVIGLGLLAGSGRQAAGQPLEPTRKTIVAARPVSHVEYDRALDATFQTALDADGNAALTMSAGDFTLEKIVAASGNATIRLTLGKDVVTIALNPQGYTVARGKRSARFNPAAPRDKDLDAVRSLLLGSRAVRAFRELSAALESRQGDDTVMVLAMLLDGAVVDMLDGDPGATDRIAKRVTRKHRAGLQPAIYRSAQFVDCVLNYELSLLYSYDLYWTCLQTAENNPWYIWWFSKGMCEWEFMIRSQQYIYQFIACFAIPSLPG